MTKSSPKPRTFVLFGSQFLFLLMSMLLLLEVAMACLGGRGYIGSAGFNEGCSNDAWCKDGLECSDLGKFACLNGYAFKLLQFYDSTRGKCVSAVGKLCNLEDKKDDLPPLDCVPYAKCVRPQGVGNSLADIFGYCQCLEGFETTEVHFCKPIGARAPVPVVHSASTSKTDGIPAPNVAPMVEHQGWSLPVHPAKTAKPIQTKMDNKLKKKLSPGSVFTNKVEKTLDSGSGKKKLQNKLQPARNAWKDLKTNAKDTN